jgi:uncharacterized protein (DUF2267 family)
MDYEQFISSVEDAVGPADGPTTLRTLADRLSGVQARSVIVRLAPEPASTPLPSGPPVHIDLDEYRPRVGEWGHPGGTAARRAEVVFSTLLEILGPDTFERRAGQPPEPLSSRSPAVSAVPASVYFGKVAPPAHVVEDIARRFADAVLETLAERINPVEVDGLIERLPVELQPVLRHAPQIYPGTGKHVRLQRLLDHVAERDDTCEALEAQPSRPALSVRPEATIENDLLHLARQLAFRLPPGYTLRWDSR